MHEHFPPGGFVAAESAIEGIEVYRPAPPSPDAHREMVDFKCPHCGATTAYSVADGGLSCTHCGYYEPPVLGMVGGAAEEFEFTLETMQRAARGWGHIRKEIRCQGCGAQISIPPEMLAYTCPFCGSNRVIQREPLQDQLRPRFLVPFTIEPHACQRIVREWLGSTWMTPSSLRKLAHFGAFAPVYLPYWTFDADIGADWQAEVAHTKTKRQFSGGRWKTRTVTEWKWESGHTQLNVDDLLVRGASHLSSILLEGVERFDLSELAPYEPKYLAGMNAQAYEITLDDAWLVGHKVIREMARKACREQASGPRVRNLGVNLDFANETWRYILLPVHVAAYRFQGRVYQVLVNGQTGAIAGQRPVSWLKLALASAGVLAPGLLLCLVGAVMLAYEMGGLIPGAIGTILLLIGVGITAKWVLEATRLDDA